MFQLTAEEAGGLRSQIAMLKKGRGQHRKYRPYAFTEHGALQEAVSERSRGGRERHRWENQQVEMGGST
jgi:hypothetical protein